MMTPLQYGIIGALATASAISVMFFDKRGKTHKPLASVIAYLIFLQMAALGAAYLRADRLIVWLLILGLALYTGSILLARGNVTKIQPPGNRSKSS